MICRYASLWNAWMFVALYEASAAIVSKVYLMPPNESAEQANASRPNAPIIVSVATIIKYLTGGLHKLITPVRHIGYLAHNSIAEREEI